MLIMNNDYHLLYLLAAIDALEDRIKELESENKKLKENK